MTETNHIDCEHCKYEPISLLAYPCDSCSDNFDKFEPKDTKPAPNNQTAKADAGKPQHAQRGGRHMTFRKFRNDSERKVFLSDYTNKKNGWEVWKYDSGLERTWWRLHLTDDIDIVVEEERRTFAYPERTVKWVPIQWYITDQKIAEYQCGDQTPHFGDYRSSKTVALAYLKACEKGEL